MKCKPGTGHKRLYYKFVFLLILSLLSVWALFQFNSVHVKGIYVSVEQWFGKDSASVIDIALNMDYSGDIPQLVTERYPSHCIVNMKGIPPVDAPFLFSKDYTYNVEVQHYYPKTSPRNWHTNDAFDELLEAFDGDTTAFCNARSLYEINIKLTPPPSLYYSLNKEKKVVSGKECAVYIAPFEEKEDSIFKQSVVDIRNLLLVKDAYNVRIPIFSDNLFTSNLFSLYDISQSYIHLEMNQYIARYNNISLTLNCAGATEFSQMDPEPDLVTMNGITFNDRDKLKQICENGLLMHATYKQMINLQTIRMYVLTTLLAWFVAELAMCFIALVKRKIK